MAENPYKWVDMIAARAPLPSLPVPDDYLKWPTDDKVDHKTIEFKRGFFTARPFASPPMKTWVAGKSPRLKQIRRGHFKGGSRVMTADGPGPIFLEDPLAYSNPLTKMDDDEHIEESEQQQQQQQDRFGNTQGSDAGSQTSKLPAMVDLSNTIREAPPLDLQKLSETDDQFHWHRDAFDSLAPPTRKDVDLVRKWLKKSVEDLRRSYDNASSNDEFAMKMLALYGRGFNEIARQVSVNCADRGKLMLDIWLSQASVFEWWISRIQIDKIQKEEKLEFFQKQFDSVLGKLLAEGDLDDYLKSKDAKIQEITENNEMLQKDVEDLRHSLHVETEKRKEKSLEAANFRQKLNLWLPNYENFQDSRITGLIGKANSGIGEIPASPEDFLINDMARMVQALTDANSSCGLSVLTVVERTLKQRGVDIPPTPKEKKLTRENQTQHELIISLQVELESVSQQLSDARSKGEIASYQLQDVKRRLDFAASSNKNMSNTIAKLEAELTELRNADPQKFVGQLHAQHNKILHSVDSQGNASRNSCIPPIIKAVLLTDVQHLECPKDHSIEFTISKRSLSFMTKLLLLNRILDIHEAESRGVTCSSFAEFVYRFFLGWFGQQHLAETGLVSVVSSSSRLHSHARVISIFARFCGCFDALPGSASDLYCFAYSYLLFAPKTGGYSLCVDDAVWLLLTWVMETVSKIFVRMPRELISNLHNALKANSTDMKIYGESGHMIGEAKIERDVVLDLIVQFHETWIWEYERHITNLFQENVDDNSSYPMDFDTFTKLMNTDRSDVSSTRISLLYNECLRCCNASKPAFTSEDLLGVLKRHGIGPFYPTAGSLQEITSALTPEITECKEVLLREFGKQLTEDVSPLSGNVRHAPIHEQSGVNEVLSGAKSQIERLNDMLKPANREGEMAEYMVRESLMDKAHRMDKCHKMYRKILADVSFVKTMTQPKK